MHVVDRLAALARSLAGIVDLPTGERLDAVLAAAGRDGAVARVRTGWTGGTVSIELANLGHPDDRDHDEADAMVRSVAARLGLPPADALAVDVRAGYGSRVLLASGHWVVAVAAVQEGVDLPLIVEGRGQATVTRRGTAHCGGCGSPVRARSRGTCPPGCCTSWC